MIKFTVIFFFFNETIKHSVYCGKNGLAGSQNGRIESRLEALPRDSMV